MANQSRFNIIVLIAALILSLAYEPECASAQARPGNLPDSIKLSDQFNKESELGRREQNVTLVVIYSAQRDAAVYLKAWNDILLPVVSGKARLALAADLSAVPFFVPKGSITKDLAKDYPDVSILLDWQGALSKPLALGKEKVVAVVYKNGLPLGWVWGVASESGAKQLGVFLEN